MAGLPDESASKSKAVNTVTGQSDGRPLSSFLGAEPGDIEAILNIFKSVANAVSAIHASGGNHLPLSPQNIWLSGSGEAEIKTGTAARDQAEPIVFQDPKYSAPEAFFKTATRCELVDTYVLGFIFYELLMGKLLFSQQFAAIENGSPSNWLRWHANRTLKALSLEEGRSNVPHRLSTLIDRMMEKDPEKRTPDLHTAIAVLSCVNDEKPVSLTRSQPAGSERIVSTVRKTFRVAPKRSPSFPFTKRILWYSVVAVFAMVAAFLISRKASQPPKRTPPAAQVSLPQAALRPPLVSLPPHPEPPAAPQSNVSLQIRSDLQNTRVLVDNQSSFNLRTAESFSQLLQPGQHKLRVLGAGGATLLVRVEIKPDGGIQFSHLEGASVRCILLASGAASTKLYAVPQARVRVADQSFKSLSSDGVVVPNNLPAEVRYRDGTETLIEPSESLAPSIRVIIQPESGERVPLQITANVPDAVMVVNDQALKQRLKGGVGVAYLPPGTYRVKVVRTGFRDSAEQQLTIGAGDSPPPLKFLLAEAVPEVRLIVDSAPAGAEVILDGKHAGVIDSAGRYQSNVATGKHTLTLRKPNFEEFTTSRDFELGNDMKISTEGMKAFGRLTFHVSPATAHILCVPDKEGEPRDCSNNEGCYLRAGMYEITVSAANFKTEIYRVRIEPGDSKSFEWELAATSLAKPASSGPESLFENGKDWTINELGWWSHTQSGYSFMRVNRGTFVFDILKRHGALSHPKISFVADFRGDTNRVLYTIDEHTLRRNVRNPGVGLEDFVVAHGMPPDSNYRLKVEILPDHVVIHSGDGKILDDFPLVKPVTGKFGFVGKVTLMVVEQQSDLEK